MQQKRIGILYITYDGLCDPLGQSQVIPYIKGLADRGVNIVVLSYEKKGRINEAAVLEAIKSEFDQHKIIWKYLSYHNNPRFFATLYDIVSGVMSGLSLIGKYELDIVHARGYVPAFIASWIKRFTKIRFIFDMRGFWVEEKVDSGFWRKGGISYRIAKFPEKNILNLADQVIVLTQKAKQFLSAHADGSGMDIDVVPTCVNSDLFKRHPALRGIFCKTR